MKNNSNLLLTRVYLAVTFASLSTAFLISGCASSPNIKQQQYAKMGDRRTFEYDFPTVWKAIEATFANYKVVDRDPDEVGVIEMKSLRKRTLETGWIYGQSRDKYIEYKLNGFPKKQYLQTRVKYNLVANSVMGGVEVAIVTSEELERLKDDGSPDGYVRAENLDTSRASEMLDKINNSILALPNT